MRQNLVVIFIILPERLDQIPGHIVMQITTDLRAMHAHKVDFRLYTTESTHKSIKNEMASMGINAEFIDKNSHISNKNFSETINTILASKDIQSNKKTKKLFFFPWWDLIPLNDLSKIDNTLLVNSIKWFTIAHVSTHLRVNKVSRETNFLKFAKKSQTLHKVFYWDTLPEDAFENEFRSFVNRLPEYHPFPEDRNLDKSSHDLTIGFFGSQSIKRGKITFILLAMMNPSIKFVGVGPSVDEKIYFPRLNKLIIFGPKLNLILRKSFKIIESFIKNYSQLEMYFQNQKEFNQAIIELDAIFVAGHLMPYSSGVALQALACGVPVLWTHGNSAHSDQMKINFPMGEIGIIEKVVPYFLHYKLTKFVKSTIPGPTVDFKTYAKHFIAQLN